MGQKGIILFLRFRKNISSYLNPKGDDSSFKIDGFMATKMGVAGLIFEPLPPNFENQYNF